MSEFRVARTDERFQLIHFAGDRLDGLTDAGLLFLKRLARDARMPLPRPDHVEHRLAVVAGEDERAVYRAWVSEGLSKLRCRVGGRINV